MPRNVILAAALPAPPERLYDMYLDADSHTAFTGAPAAVEPRPGSPFRAFDGVLPGTIVQTWRSANWGAEAIDSVLVLTFWPDGEGGRIELAHINVADDDFAGVSRGWEKYYWPPWRAYLSAGRPLD